MIDIKALAAEYDCRQEVQDILGAPKHKTAKTWSWCCPFHSESTPSFHAYEDHYYCYGCEAHGDILDWWAYSRNTTVAEIIRENNIKPVSPEERQRIATRQAEQAAKDLQEKIEQAQKALKELQESRAWMRYHDNLTDESRALWRERGIPDEWQVFWKFGYSPACPTYRQSPSLTIPIWTPDQADPIQIRHRLLRPSSESPHDKYRPEQVGLPAVPFYGDPDLPVERAERILVVEGEIKAAVTLLTVDTPLWQVIGVPGKSAFETVAKSLLGHDGVWLIPDPGAEASWREKATQIKARVLVLGGKIDDLLNAGTLEKHTLFGMLDQARRTA